MSQFKFRLATLLRLREMTRDQRRAALAEAYHIDDLLRQQIARIDEEFQGLKDFGRRTAGPGSVNVDSLVEAQRYEAVLRMERMKVEGQRKVVAEEIGRRQQVLLEADREVRMLEKLREKQAEQFIREQERREQLRLDEAAQQLAMREAVS